MALVTCVLNSDDIIAAINQAKEQIMAKIQDEVARVTAAVADIKDAVSPLSASIDALEAKITAATQNPDVPQAVSDQLTAALADLKTVSDGIKAAVTDAADGVDEGATTEPPTT